MNRKNKRYVDVCIAKTREVYKIVKKRKIACFAELINAILDDRKKFDFVTDTYPFWIAITEGESLYGPNREIADMRRIESKKDAVLLCNMIKENETCKSFPEFAEYIMNEQPQLLNTLGNHPTFFWMFFNGVMKLKKSSD